MQKNVFTTEELKEIIDGLYNTIGIRMNVNLNNYPWIDGRSSVEQSSFCDVCKVITDHLELPIVVMPTFSQTFKTQDLVLNEGNGTLGIGAQIHIPGNLPYYKTEAMKKFPIAITVPPEALAQGQYFLMTQLSHEFSHIYLYSRRDPQKENEWATDLCALMMGFTPLWIQGRKQTIRQNDSNGIVTKTQGYLSDSGYSFALDYINTLRNSFEQMRLNISDLKNAIQRECNDISQYLNDVYLLHDFHYKHPHKSFIRKDDADVFSKLAQPQYRKEIETLLKDSKRDVNNVITPLRNQKEFYKKDEKLMEDNYEVLKTIEEKLRNTFDELRNDLNVVLHHIDVEYYTGIHNSRIKSMKKGIKVGTKLIQKLSKRIDVLDRTLTLYKENKKVKDPSESDAKTISLINADYVGSSRAFVKKMQEKIDEIKGALKKARYFYSIDDSILLAQVSELENACNTLNYCLAEQKSHLRVLMRNLNFFGKIKYLF